MRDRSLMGQHEWIRADLATILEQRQNVSYAAAMNLSILHDRDEARVAGHVCETNVNVLQRSQSSHHHPFPL
jgi:hypothetical protein